VADPDPVVRARPRLRGVSHKYAFFASLGPGIALIVTSAGAAARTAAIVYACSAAAMFGMSALYHRVTWSESARRRACRFDHATVYLMIAGSYTPVGLLVLSGTTRIVVLAIVWSGALFGIVLKACWVDAPKWSAAALGLALGGVGLFALPQLVSVGAAGFTLMIVGGACYAAGAVVYAMRRPDPHPSVFGYHEVFHALVIAAVACQYVGVAFFIVH
jgi:hemolysin III